MAAVAGSSRSMRVSILPPSKPIARDRRGVVRREAVVELEDRALQAAAVHRADDDLVLEGAEQQQVLEDVGRAEHPVDAGPRQGGREPVEQVAAARHRGGVGRATRSAPRAGWSAATSSSRPSVAQQPGDGGRRGRRQPRRCGPDLGAAASATRSVDWSSIGCSQRRVDARRLRGWRERRVDLGRRCGMAVEHSSRDGDDRPGRRWRTAGSRSSGPAGEQAVAQRAAEGVPGAEAVDDLDRERAAPRRARRACAASTPSGPCLTTASSTPRVQQRVGGRAPGRVSPTATSHSSRLPTATVDVRQRRAAPASLRLAARRPEHRPVVEVEHGAAAASPRACQRGDGAPCGSAPGDRPVTVDPEDAGRRDRVEVELVGADLQVRRGRAAGRSTAGSRRAGRSRRTSPASAGPAPRETNRSSTPKPRSARWT